MKSDAGLAPELLAFMHELADLSGRVILPYFRADRAVWNKSGGTRFNPVTAADREAEQALRAAIGDRYPDHGITGEEYGDRPGSSNYRWVIDPIDGTEAFVCGLPTWGTLIGVCDGLRPLCGVMNQPYVGERFIGGCGDARLLTPAADFKLAARGADALADAVLFATSPAMFRAGAERAAFETLSAAVRTTRFGVDCYAYCLLAAGRIDLVVEADLGFYDIAPLVPIVESAGGILTDWHGNPVRSGGQVIAAGAPILHSRALEYLKPAADETVS